MKDELLNDLNSNETTIIQTDIGSKNGQDKCSKCGSTDISVNANTGQLRCNFCRYQFSSERISGMVEDLNKLQGEVIGSGATDIVADSASTITLKCESCGAEVVIDTESVTQARCHWCRNTLSINRKIPNGAIPDVVLPFMIPKEEAEKQIDYFVSKRKFFAHPKFTKEFTSANIMGVYFPYMVVDVNAHSYLKGRGEKLIKMYSSGSEDSTTYYDADEFAVERHFDMIVDGLTIESNFDRLNTSSAEKTNNIINSIMPFDTENCVKYNSNYLKGYTSERRDTNTDTLKPIVEVQVKDIARISMNETLKQYDRGVHWSEETIDIKGIQWKAAYLPVWLYSYQEEKGSNKIIHYVAVNARTKEIMGSVPIHMPKLILTSAMVEVLGFFAMIKIEFDYSWIFLSVGIVYFIVMFTKYRNSNARHKYESETKTKIENLVKNDTHLRKKTRLTNSRIAGMNNTMVYGQSMNGIGNRLVDAITSKNPLANMMNGLDDKDE